MAVMSVSIGTLRSRRVSRVSRQAAISTRAEFLAPLTGLSPESRRPPRTSSRGWRIGWVATALNVMNSIPC